jgi:hypothetical protein
MASASGSRPDTRPWGTLCGLVVGCVVTPIAAWRGLAPDVILLRAAVAGVVSGAVVVLFRRIVQRFFLRSKA